MWWRLFGSHPASVGETYATHLLHALGFAAAMLLGGLACLVHAVLPCAFQRTGSDVVRQLHDRMVVNRIGANHGRSAGSETATE